MKPSLGKAFASITFLSFSLFSLSQFETETELIGLKCFQASKSTINQEPSYVLIDKNQKKIELFSSPILKTDGSFNLYEFKLLNSGKNEDHKNNKPPKMNQPNSKNKNNDDKYYGESRRHKIWIDRTNLSMNFGLSYQNLIKFEQYECFKIQSNKLLENLEDLRRKYVDKRKI
tara:strand:- start:208 stop:726 length:519 start_codon:yes stop_codon:yes gene_type:complete